MLSTRNRRLRGKLGFSRDDGEAVVFVSWVDAVGFCQSADGVIHLITSQRDYAFSLAWLKTPMPPEQEGR
jgi:hypothetical protein